MANFNPKLLKSHKPWAFFPMRELRLVKEGSYRGPSAPRTTGAKAVLQEGLGGSARRGGRTLAEGCPGSHPGAPRLRPGLEHVTRKEPADAAAPKVRTPSQPSPHAHLRRRSPGRRDTCAGRCREPRTPASPWGRGQAQSTSAGSKGALRGGAGGGAAGAGRGRRLLRTSWEAPSYLRALGLGCGPPSPGGALVTV